MDIGLIFQIGERKGYRVVLMEMRWLLIQLFQSHPLSSFTLSFNIILNEMNEWFDLTNPITFDGI